MQAVLAGLQRQTMVCKHDGDPKKAWTGGYSQGRTKAKRQPISAQLLETALAAKKHVFDGMERDRGLQEGAERTKTV